MNKCKFYCTTLENVSVKKGDTILLENISLKLNGNEITAIIGPNGAGKTTLFRTLLGEEPYKGEIRYMDCDDGVYKPIIGYVPQHLNFDRSTPISVLDLFASCLQHAPAWRKQSKIFTDKVKKLLEEVDLGYAIERKIGALSGGELQRVLLTLALTPTPDILLLDEPISGVDLKGEQKFYEMVKLLKEKYHMAIILITHDIPLLPEICDRVILLNKTILCEGTPNEVLGNEKTKQLFYLG